MSDPLRTVWILGSGFSRPLGGPLLDELIAPGSEEDLENKFSRWRHDGNVDFRLVESLYNEGKPIKERHSRQNTSTHPRQYWSNAEQFMEVVDRASSNPDCLANSTLKRTIRSVLNNSVNDKQAAPIEKVASMVKRYIAAQCLLFTEEADLSSEVWRSYKRWAVLLKEAVRTSHNVVTFNYDLVPERIGFHTVPPNEQFLETDSNEVSVYKLHGSVNWRKLHDGISIKPIESALTIEGNEEIAIAVPGRSKSENVHGAFNSSWKGALNSILGADSLVFVGYRFPESDVEAMALVLSAMQINTRKHLSVNIVLGPRTASDDIVRLKHLVECSLVERRNAPRFDTKQIRTFQLRVHPMYAQDFLALYSPKLIHS